jgi:hypothetical protein
MPPQQGDGLPDLFDAAFCFGAHVSVLFAGAFLKLSLFLTPNRYPLRRKTL